MFKHKLAKQLDNLLQEGKEIITTTENDVDGRTLRLWFASVSDILKLILPVESALLSEFNKIVKDMDKHNGSFSKDEANNIIDTTSQIFNRVRKINLLRSNKSDSQELEHEMRLIINEPHFKRRLFYLPVIVLVIAAGFAITGVLQIRNVKVDLRKLTSDAVEHVKKDINIQIKDINKDIDIFVKDEKKKISTTVNKHIRELNEQNTEDKETIQRLNSELKLYKKQVETLNDGLGEIENRIARIRPERVPNLIESISIAINHAQSFFWGVSFFCGVALILSVLAWCFPRKQPQNKHK